MPDSTDLIARYEGYRRADPGNVHLLLALGDLYHHAGRFDDALAAFRAGLTADPQFAALRSREASVLLSLHRFAEAEAAIRPLIDADPGNPALQHNLGLALYHQHKFEAARGAFAAAASGGESETWRHLAYASHHAGDLESARSAAARWAELAPSTRAEGYLALVEFDSLDHDGAYRRARATLEADPDNVDASVVGGVEALEQQDIDRAERLYAQASSLEPDNARAWLGVALVRLYREEHARAIEAFERSLALDPRNTGTLVALGWTHIAIANYPGAERAFRRALVVDHNFGEAHGGLASALVMQDRRDEAQREIALARRLAARGFGYVYAQGVLLGLQGQVELGGRLIDRALERPARPGLPSLREQLRVFTSRRLPPQLPPPADSDSGPPGPPAAPRA